MKLKEWLARDWDEVENLDHVHPRIRRIVRPLLAFIRLDDDK